MDTGSVRLTVDLAWRISVDSAFEGDRERVDGSFEPVIVPKREPRLDGTDQVVLSLWSRGLTTGEIAAHFEEVYGARVSKDTISRITEKVGNASPPATTAHASSTQ